MDPVQENKQLNENTCLPGETVDLELESEVATGYLDNWVRVIPCSLIKLLTKVKIMSKRISFFTRYNNSQHFASFYSQ